MNRLRIAAAAASSSLGPRLPHSSRNCDAPLPMKRASLLLRENRVCDARETGARDYLSVQKAIRSCVRVRERERGGRESSA
eukprot:4969275-Pleurochrysis_carterae.AAC.1